MPGPAFFPDGKAGAPPALPLPLPSPPSPGGQRSQFARPTLGQRLIACLPSPFQHLAFSIQPFLLFCLLPSFFLRTFQLFSFLAFQFFLLPPSLHSAEPWLSSLASPPEWRLLDRYQKSITRAEFETLVRQVYSLDGDFFRYLDLSDEKAVLWREPEKINLLWTLDFAPTATATQNRPSLYFPTDTSDLRGATPEKPLNGLKILLDPGHIGGEWAYMEQRDLRIGNNPPVREAELNLITCRHLATLLQTAGAEVLWTKTDFNPVTPLRPDDLKAEAQELILSRNPDAVKLGKNELLQAIKSRSEMLFYRVAEIQARAALAEQFKPDLTLCVHFNAAPDPRPGRPSLFDKNKLVVFVNGSYLPDELVFDDIKFHLLQKILERSSPAETAIARDIGNAMEKELKIPPENYTNWPSANRITESPYVWSRNLIANRLFPGPVVFVEGPYMNDRVSYNRLLAGDYEGTQIIDGTPQPSIFREYAQTIYQGVLAYYTTPPATGPEGSPIPSIPLVPFVPPPPTVPEPPPAILPETPNPSQSPSPDTPPPPSHP